MTGSDGTGMAIASAASRSCIFRVRPVEFKHEPL
jgi:hypothetical protein